MKNEHKPRGMPSRGTILTVIIVGIVMLSGCAGWGSDGPADQDDAEPAQADDVEDESNATESDGNGDADADSSDSNSDTDTNAEGDSSTDTDTNSDSDSATNNGADDAADDSSDSSAVDSQGGDSDERTDDLGEKSGDGDSSDSTDSDDSDDSDGTNGDNSSDGDDGVTDGDTGDGDEDDGGAGDGADDGVEDPPHTLTVTVVNGDEPVEGAAVGAYGPVLDNGAAHEPSGNTDANGQVVLEVYDGTYTVETNTGSGDATTDVDVSGDSEVTLDISDDTDPGEETHTLTVTVTDEQSGEPVPDASVSVVTYDGGADVGSATTNDEGVAEIEMESGSYEVTVSHDDYVAAERELIDVENDRSLGIEMSIPDDEANTATGKVIVRDQNGDPVEGEQVLLRPPGTVEDDAREERFTNEDGEVVIELAAGDPTDVVNYGVEVRGEEKQLGIMSDEHSDPAVQTVEFEVSENSMHAFTRTIRVVDENGPVEGELVEARNMGVSEFSEVGTTDENGGVTLTASSSDSGDAFMFDVRVAGTTVTGVAVDATDQEPKEIQIGPQEPETVGDLTIVTVDEDTEEPITDATVTAEHLDSGDTFEIPTNADGEAVFENVPHGEYAVAVEADGWTTAEETVAFEGDTDEEADLRQTIQLSPEQSGDETDESLTVVVEDEAENPVAGEPVTITYEDESTSERETNDDGEVVLEFDITDDSADIVTVNVEVRDENRDVIIEDGEDLTKMFTVSADDEGEGAATASVTPHMSVEMITIFHP